MTRDEADAALLFNMRRLSLEMGMLTGLTVGFGTSNHYDSFYVGLKREVKKTPGGFEPARREITGNTVYDLASLTKLFTLVSVLQLIERGKLAFEDSLGQVDRRFQSLDRCTVLDCLSYRAKLRTPERIDAQPDAESARRMVFLCGQVGDDGGKRYSDINALVLKYLVEKVSGQGFYAYLADNVLKPLGMRETWVRVPQERVNDLMDYNYEHRVLDGQYQVCDQALPGLPHDPKARVLGDGGRELSGHAGLFSTQGDLCRFAQGLLSGALLKPDTVLSIGVNRTGYLTCAGDYRQFLGLLCFSKSPVARLSELPSFMGLRSFALAGYTGNHLAIDPELGIFDLILGNRCHNRVSRVMPAEGAQKLGLAPDGSGLVRWPDGRMVKSSYQYIYQKDAMLHAPVRDCLLARGWLREEVQ